MPNAHITHLNKHMLSFKNKLHTISSCPPGNHDGIDRKQYAYIARTYSYNIIQRSSCVRKNDVCGRYSLTNTKLATALVAFYSKTTKITTTKPQQDYWAIRSVSSSSLRKSAFIQRAPILYTARIESFVANAAAYTMIEILTHNIFYKHSVYLIFLSHTHTPQNTLTESNYRQPATGNHALPERWIA